MIGDKLRSEREKQNLTIKDIEKGTSIRALYIECIEKGDFSQLPGEVYTKGFIRNYANFLKIDADAAVQQYLAENNPAAAQKMAEAAEAKAVENSAPTTNVNEATTKKASTKLFATGDDFHQRVENSHRRQNMRVLILVVIVVLAGIAYLFVSDDDAKTAKQATKATQQTTQQQAKPAPKAVEPPKVDGVELEATFNDRCWTAVKVDGKDVFEGTIEKGKTEKWHGKETVVITAGNAGAVTLKLNGKDIGKAGADGQVIEKTYTPDGEQTAANAKNKSDKPANKKDGQE